MLRDAIISLIANRLNRSDMNAAILNEMSLLQATQLEGAPFLPWFTEVVDTTLSISANVETVALPSTFIREVDGAGVFYRDPTTSKWINLPKEDYDNLIEKLDETSTVPEGYAVVNQTMYFRPVPTQGLTLRLTYNQRLSDPLVDSAENGWMTWAPDLLIGTVGFVISSSYLQDDTQAKVFDLMRKEAIARLNIMHEARTHANRDYRMGGTED
jgi:hypothetical protein